MAFSLLDTVLLNTGKRRAVAALQSIYLSLVPLWCEQQAGRCVTFIRAVTIRQSYLKSDTQGKIEGLHSPRRFKRWKVEIVDEELYRPSLDGNLTCVEDTDQQAEILVRYINKACFASM